MIRVESISKSFAGVRALKDVSFEVGSHEVVGFLGPNGAGKTTMMRLLAGFFVPDEGAIEVASVDVLENPLEAKQRIGYLPEHCPLYPEMRVDEFLTYRAVMKGVLGRRIRDRLQVVKQQCGLESVGRRIIGQLSKGYRQRVGLADALIHEPDVLILDEPTNGLDPQGIHQIREIIRKIAAGGTTILLASHLLDEVEKVCSHVVIIRNGKKLYSGPVDAINASHGFFELQAKNMQLLQDLLIAHPGIENVTVKENVVTAILKEPMEAEAINEYLFEKGLSLSYLVKRKESLEEQFLEITKQTPSA